MELDRVLAELQMFGDLSGAQVLGDTGQDLEFSWVEPSSGRSSGGSARRAGGPR